jgi:hypothetical protein
LRSVGLWILPWHCAAALDEFDQPRAFEFGEIGGAVRVDLRPASACARLHRDDGHADLAPLLAGDADDGGFRTAAELMQHALDSAGYTFSPPEMYMSFQRSTM